jgi:hypothetical protein
MQVAVTATHVTDDQTLQRHSEGQLRLLVRTMADKLGAVRRNKFVLRERYNCKISVLRLWHKVPFSSRNTTNQIMTPQSYLPSEEVMREAANFNNHLLPFVRTRTA